MRRFVFSFLCLTLFVLPARADEAAIRGVISAQIEAFQADDFVQAFTFASPTIQRMFGNPETFGKMVREGYPMVWRPTDVDFLSVETIDGQLWQNVMIRDQAGQLHILEYQIVDSEDGWKINAVRKRKSADGIV